MKLREVLLVSAKDRDEDCLLHVIHDLMMAMTRALNFL